MEISTIFVVFIALLVAVCKAAGKSLKLILV
jgi:hypothetical protein